MPVSWAAASDRGLRRASNEDHYSARADLGLFVVADGMGGHAAGEVAARVAVQAIEAVIERTAPAAPGELDEDPAVTREVRRLRAAFTHANDRIREEAARTEARRGMATTVVALLLANEVATVAHVGDSRAYLWRRSALERLTEDHSWVAEQVRAGALSATAARRHPWRNVVTRALAGGATLQVEVQRRPLESGDRLLLCSDGLCAVVADAQIGAVLARPQPARAMCDDLIAAANARGGPDNVTAVVLHFDAR